MLRRVLFGPEAPPTGGGNNTPPPPAGDTNTPPPGGKPPGNEPNFYEEIENLDEDAPPKPDKDKDKDKDKSKAKDKQDPPRDPPKEEELEDDHEDPEAGKAKDPDLDEKKDNDKDQKLPTRARDLKKVYEETKHELASTKGQLDSLRKENEQLKKQGPEQTKVLSEQLEKSETRRKELEQTIRHLSYERSEEYQNKYVQPYQEAWKEALGEVEQLTVELEGQQPRSGTSEDLLEISNLPLGEARKRARELFGDSAEDVMAMRRKLIDLSNAQRKALVDARKNSETREKEEMANRKVAEERLRGLWKTENESLVERYPKWFKPDPEDEQGNQVLARGFEEVDRYWNDEQMPVEERLKLHALIRHKAANHDRMALRLKRARQQIAKLEKDLSSYEGSGPPAGGRSAGRSKVVEPTFEQEIDALDDKTPVL